VAKYKPGKSGVASRKINKLKEDIKSETDKDKIKKLEEQLAMLMAIRNQDKEGGKAISEANLERARRFMPTVPKDFDGFMDEETMAELRAGASQRDLEQGISRRNKMGGGKVHGDKKKKDMMYGSTVTKKKKNMMYGSMVTKKKKKNGMMGGGKVYASMNKRYANGGKIYPSKGKI
tara:strand:- start:89 stop:616 length:528 start_codon:yes stop_codon:yes gene_type:complete